MATSDLSELRAALAKADAEIRYAVGRRLAIARQIGEAKRAAGLPIRDYTAERGVLERWRTELSRVEIPPERAEAFARWLIEEAVRVQERGGESGEALPRASDILVVGGGGSMGAWVREFFRAGGHRVGVVDPRVDARRAKGYTVHSDLARAAQDADVIVVATPMRSAPAVYRDLLRTEAEGVIFDILSIKQPILPWVRRGISEGFHITSVHPLFGPSARTLSGRNLLVLDCGDARANHRALSLFASTSLTITELPVERHDALMAETLALPHIVGLLFGSALTQASHAPGELFRAAPTSFLRQAEASEVIASENPELAFDIQNLNPTSEALFDRLERSLSALRKAVKDGDSKGYRRQMEEVRALFAREDPFGGAPPLGGSGAGRHRAPFGTPAGRGPGHASSRSDDPAGAGSSEMS